MGGRLDPVTARILNNPLSEAQIRALKLAAKEGSLVGRGDNLRKLRWVEPSRTEPIDKPYAEGRSVFSLERLGYLQPDLKVERGPRPRPRLLTRQGQLFLEGISKLEK